LPQNCGKLVGVFGFGTNADGTVWMQIPPAGEGGVSAKVLDEDKAERPRILSCLRQNPAVASTSEGLRETSRIGTSGAVQCRHGLARRSPTSTSVSTHSSRSAKITVGIEPTVVDHPPPGTGSHTRVPISVVMDGSGR